ncbi:MAG: ferritin-like protein, partial [Spirulina sp.]
VSASGQYVLQEEPHGAFARADRFVFRLYPDEPQSTTLYAYRFGNPCPDAVFQLNHDNSVGEGFVQQGSNMVPGPQVGIPQAGLTFPQSVKTGSNGQAPITLTGRDPLIQDPRTGELVPARGYIDGQVYGVRYDWQGTDYPKEYAFPSDLLNVLVWNKYEVPAEPTWLDDIQPIFQQYANLYPVMKPIVDLSDYLSVIGRKDMLKRVFNLPPTDPRYMPVTRDLSHANSVSQGKLGMIRKWLQDLNPDDGQPLYASPWHINSVNDLKRALQTAIELEHATIPPYLCALYSIKPGHNQEIADLIRSVVLEEMLHMSLACNLLNAIEGSPDINKSDFVPQYPTGLPGDLRPDLVVSLKKCSIAQIRDVFMSIEEPDVTREPTAASETETTISIRQHHIRTIGWFYDKIKKAFQDLSCGQNIFTGDPARQVHHWYDAGNYGVTRGKMIPVTDLDSALKAIAAIQKQGEGASAINPRDGYNELAHFYKFEEIVRGRSIVLNPHGRGYSFSGAEIVFDPEGVYPMTDNPNTQSLPSGSGARLLSEQFNESYSHMLNVLHDVFNGQPDRMSDVISMMFSLSVLGRKVMETQIPGTSETAGMSFQLTSDS